MPSCFISMSFTTCGRSVFYYCHQVCGHAHLVESYWCNNCVFLFWFMDVQRWCGHICFGNQTWEHVNAIVGLFEVNRENWPFAWCVKIAIFAWKTWFIHYVIAFVKKWGRQFDNHGYNIVFYCWLWTFEPSMVLWRYLFWLGVTKAY